MQRDIRSSEAFKAVEAFYGALFSPGEGRVYAATDLAVAADGASLCFTGLSFPGSLEEGPVGGVYRMDLASGSFAPVSDGAARLPRLSPDGGRLAFVARAAGEAAERLMIAKPDGGGGTEVTGVEGLIEEAQWSPDGRSILLLIAGLGADLAGYQGGYATTAPAEGPAWLPEVKTDQEVNLWRRLWLLDAATLALRPLSAPTTNVWEASWCGPDHVAVVRSGHHGEGSWYGSTLALIATNAGAERELYRPADQIGLPAGSPDGRRVAFVEAVCSDRGIVCGTAKLVEVATGAVRTFAAQGVEVTSLAWRDESAVHFAGHNGFATVVGDFDAASLAARELWSSEKLTCGEWYPAARPLSGGRSVIVAEAYACAPQVAILEAGGLRTVKSFAGPQADAAMAGCGVMAPARWRAADGLEIHGWLARPERSAGPAPLVLDIHGGPVWAHRNRWMGRLRATALLVKAGCAVLFANPRGSSTRGQDFARLVKGDMGGADTGDFLAAIDHFVATGVADGERVACTGTSYGGFMSAWLVTQDRRFAAAAPISPVADWHSQHRTSQIPFFDEMFLADSAWRASGKFFDRSPAMFARAVATPCLVMAGALDKNTPPSQALEFHQSLLEHGVESALVTYPRDGHSLRGWPAYLDSAARILIWFGPRLGFAVGG